jgi:hypothetical protein
VAHAESWQHRDRINRLLAERVERSPEVAAQIAELISRRGTEAVSDSASD